MKTDLKGLIQGISSTDYHAMKEILSNSMIGKFETSPAHFQAYLRTPHEPTDAQEFGTIVHSTVLEPQRLSTEYAVSPKFDRRTKEGKAGAEAFAFANAGKTAVDHETWSAVSRIIDSVYSHDAASAFLRDGIAEGSVFWADAASGVRCRARPDYYRTSDGILIDVKTTRDARPRLFQRSMMDYRYDRQLAFYARGLIANGLPVNRCILIAIEKEEPFGVRVYEVPQSDIQRADLEITDILSRMAECQKTDQWPCYTQELELLGMPSYF